VWTESEHLRIGLCTGRNFENRNMAVMTISDPMVQNIGVARRIKVAYVLTPIEFGGAEKVNLTFLKNVNRSCFEIHIIVLVRPWEKCNLLKETLENAGYKIHTIPVAKRPRDQGRDLLRILRCCKLIYWFLREGNFELIHTHGYFADVISTPAAKLLGIPHLCTCHGFISDGRWLDFYNFMDRVALRFADRVIAVSSTLKGELIKKGIRTGNIEVIRNAVEMVSSEALREVQGQRRGLLGIRSDEFVVGYVGRLSREKGVRYLIEGSALLYKKGENVRTVIIGDGPEKKNLEEQARSNGILNEVIFLGFEREPGKWLPTMDVFVLPSLTEGTPMALLEAMSCGLPVIASAVGGIPEIVEPMRNGILIRAGQAAEIANCLSNLQKDEALRHRLGAEGRRTVEKRHNSKDWSIQIEKEYLKLVH
jgi:glycosyltransferase involved in cell wall biosynthesis